MTRLSYCGAILAAAILSVPVPLCAERLTGTIDLATVGSSTPGVRFQGTARDGHSGCSVSAAGDFNGDGVDDLLVGAYWSDPVGQFYVFSGATYLVYGSKAEPPSGTVSLSTIGTTTPGVRFEGANGWDRLGWSVSSAGDFNADGIDDVLMGAYGADAGGRMDAGETYLVYGSKTDPLSGTVNVSSVGTTTPGVRFEGAEVAEGAGRSVSSAGDANGDGVDDLLIGAYRESPINANPLSKVYLVYGSGLSPLSGTVDLSTVGTTTPGARFDGINRFRRYHDPSSFVSSAGDINGDGVDDLLIGDSEAPPGGYWVGKTYLVYGSKLSPLSGTLDLATVGSDTAGVRFEGLGNHDKTGWSVSSAGDVNGDGVEDLLIGAPEAGPAPFKPGEAYLVYGSKSNPLSGIVDLATVGATTAGVRFKGTNHSDYSGYSVASAGDVDGDGFDDVLVGAKNVDPNGRSGAGETYLIYGSATLSGTIDLSTVGTTTPGLRFTGALAADLSGSSVSSAGDINGDGYPDLLIGAPYASPGGTWWMGETYLIYGVPEPSTWAMAGLAALCLAGSAALRRRRR